MNRPLTTTCLENFAGKLSHCQFSKFDAHYKRDLLLTDSTFYTFRPDRRNIAIILTDGKSTRDTSNTIPFAEELQKIASVFVLGKVQNLQIIF